MGEDPRLYFGRIISRGEDRGAFNDVAAAGAGSGKTFDGRADFRFHNAPFRWGQPNIPDIHF
jgi:hypothetical protein